MRAIIITAAIFCFVCIVTSVKKCKPDDCKAPNCSCISTVPPFNHTKDDIPQFIIMTFDEAVRITNFPIYSKLSNYKNPNGCPLQATFFVSHVDTNYKLVHDLHRKGHEIAAHSISKNSNSEYWKKLDENGWKQEFGGIRNIISALAEIPKEDIRGARAPNLQTAGNVTIEAFIKAGFKYDCSMPARKAVTKNSPFQPYFPYTFDYGFQRDDDCQIRPCLTENQTFPGFWSVPMNDWFTLMPVDPDNPNNTINRECASVDGCIFFNKDGTANYDPTVDEIVKLFESNFERFYSTNRAPFPLFLREAWLSANPNRQLALIKFIENMNKKKDVFFVSISDVIEWMESGANGTSINNYKPSSCVLTPKDTPCMVKTLNELQAQGKHCKMEKIPVLNKQDKTLIICDNVDCPDKYPWIGNDLGY